MQNPAPSAMPPTDALADDLRALGLAAGDGVIVHSSLRRFGYVEGGPATVLAALQAVLTPDGTLLLPSFNHGGAFADGAPGVFDPQRTPTTNGAIPDHFWRLPGVHRSLDPTHAFAAWGKNARRYVEGHHRTLTMGPRSPLGLLSADGGYGLLLGVDFVANTFHHVVETTLGAPCLGRRTEAYPVRLPDGRRTLGRTWSWRGGTCPFTDQNRYGALLRERGLRREGNIGSCPAILFRLQDCFDVVAELLQRGGFGFPGCAGCPVRPRQHPATVSSDWDDAADAPATDSAAWTY